ncbi:DNA methyltransferase [Microbacterium sp. YY-01]|uniref:DNA methyltransferase n=1 Tax=Microbacterium sp. YY-01 TaxID=3421634 RepID=UPI003D17D0D6
MPLPLPARLDATHAQFVHEHPPGADESVHMLQSVVDEVIHACSPVGGVVFDPFAGFGTTLARAVALGRRALGIELLPERVEYIAARVPQARVVEGDARELLRLINNVPDAGIDLVLCSPPYMTATHHEADPLMAYETDGGDYDRYLAELGLVAAQCARAVKPGGYVVWNVADIHHMNHTTRLIQACHDVLSRHLTAVGTVEINWDRLPHDLVADALLVFQR